jgi:hypothetical protein
MKPAVPLPTWMRRVLWATGVMNVLAAGAFLPGAGALRALLGFPAAGHPFYVATAGLFVLLFGAGYLWSAASGRADRIFLGVAGVGKIAFFSLTVAFWAAGELPVHGPALASADLVFGTLFLVYLARSRAEHDAVRARHAA